MNRKQITAFVHNQLIKQCRHFAVYSATVQLCPVCVFHCAIFEHELLSVLQDVKLLAAVNSGIIANIIVA